MTITLPGKCSRHAAYDPACRYCRNLSGTTLIDPPDFGAPVIGQVPDMGDAYPSLAGLIPLYDRIIVLPIEPGESHGGIIIPETVSDAWPFGVGRVLATGAGRIALSSGELKPLTVEVGDVVVYDRKAGFELPWDDELEAVCLHEPAILGHMPRAQKLANRELEGAA